MKFNLVFETSGDCIPFEVKYNHNLINFFIKQSESNLQNSFYIEETTSTNISSKISDLHWAITKTNEVLYELIGEKISDQADLTNYLDQKFLNLIHCEWASTQLKKVNIDTLRHSVSKSQCKIGNFLHEQYPDDIRTIKIAEALSKLGYIVPYEEVNMGVHRLEDSFRSIEFKADNKWDVFTNPYVDSMITNNDVVNFSFGYTYVGRQYYNKFKFFDTDLHYKDNYNYETLEFAFQINLNRPETIPFSQEAIKWAENKGIKLVAEQIPIGNAINLDKKLFDYRKILYNNTKQGNRAKLILQ